jgi:hypothetical protein
MNIQKPKYTTSSPWITLAILSGLGIVSVSAGALSKSGQSGVGTLEFGARSQTVI